MANTPPKTCFFELLQPLSHEIGPRIGRLYTRGRAPMDTPHYIAVSSRGAVPHLSQDTLGQSTAIKGLYTALEDCMP